jgi:hypothetical protein
MRLRPTYKRVNYYGYTGNGRDHLCRPTPNKQGHLEALCSKDRQCRDDISTPQGVEVLEQQKYPGGHLCQRCLKIAKTETQKWHQEENCPWSKQQIKTLMKEAREPWGLGWRMLSDKQKQAAYADRICFWLLGQCESSDERINLGGIKALIQAVLAEAGLTDN